MGISSHASLFLGLILALVTAAAFNWSWVAQHSITSKLPKLSVRHPWRSYGILFGHRRWLFAFMVGIVGWGLYILALKLAPGAPRGLRRLSLFPQTARPRREKDVPCLS